MPNSNFPNWKESIGKYAPGTAIVLTLIYLFGFVIVSSYLGKFGIKSSEIFEFRYLIIGMIFLAIVVANTVLHLFSVHTEVTTPSKTIGQFLARKISFSCDFILFNIAVGLLILFGIPDKSKLIFLTTVVTCIALDKVLVKRKIMLIREVLELLLVVMMLILLRRTKLFTFFLWALSIKVVLFFHFDIPEVQLLKRITWLEKRGFWISKVAILSLILFLSCSVFGDYFYDRVHRFLGGGKPRIVQFVTSDNGTTLLNQLGIDMRRDELSPPLFLINESDNEYYILESTSSQKPRAIGIRKDKVKGIVFSR